MGLLERVWGWLFTNSFESGIQLWTGHGDGERFNTQAGTAFQGLVATMRIAASRMLLVFTLCG